MKETVILFLFPYESFKEATANCALDDLEAVEKFHHLRIALNLDPARLCLEKPRVHDPR